MVAALAVSPSAPATSQNVLVTLTGAGDYRTRILLDSVEAGSMCYITGGTGTVTITMGSAAGTQTVDAEQMIAGTWTNVATLNADVSTSSIGTFSGSTPDSLITMMKRTDIDVIELPAGTYSDWNVYVRLSRAFRPLTIRPATGATVIFDGSGLGSGANGAFYFGSNVGAPGVPLFVTDYITLDGSTGTLRITGYDIGHSGLILTGWVNQMAFNAIDITGCSGSGGSFSHCLYVNSDDIHHGTNISADDWTIAGDVGRTLNGVQTFHNPNVIGLGVDNWTVDRLNRWAFLYGDASGIALTNWDGTNCNATIDSPSILGTDHATGAVTGCNAHGSCGPIAVGSGSWINTGITGSGNSA